MTPRLLDFLLKCVKTLLRLTRQKRLNKTGGNDEVSDGAFPELRTWPFPKLPWECRLGEGWGLAAETITHFSEDQTWPDRSACASNFSSIFSTSWIGKDNKIYQT